MFLLGVSGQQRVGKDSVVDCLIKTLPNRKIVRTAFADELKRECSIATGYSVEFMEEHKELFRPLWQWWGTEFRRGLKGKDYWINKWLSKVAKLPDTTYCTVVTDVRFKNEADVIRDTGGILLRVERHAAKKGDTHLSETELTKDNYDYNFIINNNGTLSDLKHEVGRIAKLCGMSSFAA